MHQKNSQVMFLLFVFLIISAVLSFTACDLLGQENDDKDSVTGTISDGTISGLWAFSIGYYPSGAVHIYTDTDADPANGYVKRTIVSTPGTAPSSGLYSMDIGAGTYYVYAICYSINSGSEVDSTPVAGHYIGYYSTSSDNGDPGAANVTITAGKVTTASINLDPIYGVSGTITSTLPVTGRWYLRLLNQSKSYAYQIGNGTFSGTTAGYSLQLADVPAGDYYLIAVIDVTGSSTAYDPAETSPATDFNEDSIGSYQGTAGAYPSGLPVAANLKFRGVNDPPNSVVHADINITVDVFDTL